MIFIPSARHGMYDAVKGVPRPNRDISDPQASESVALGCVQVVVLTEIHVVIQAGSDNATLVTSHQVSLKILLWPL